MHAWTMPVTMRTWDCARAIQELETAQDEARQSKQHAQGHQQAAKEAKAKMIDAQQLIAVSKKETEAAKTKSEADVAEKEKHREAAQDSAARLDQSTKEIKLLNAKIAELEKGVQRATDEIHVLNAGKEAY